MRKKISDPVHLSENGNKQTTGNLEMEKKHETVANDSNTKITPGVYCELI